MSIDQILDLVADAASVLVAVAGAVAAYAAWRSARASEETARYSRKLAEDEIRYRLDVLLAEVEVVAGDILRSVRQAVGEWTVIFAGSGVEPSSGSVQSVLRDVEARSSRPALALQEAAEIKRKRADMTPEEVRVALSKFEAWRVELRHVQLAVQEDREKRIERRASMRRPS
jgi:hypothetical protein